MTSSTPDPNADANAQPEKSCDRRSFFAIATAVTTTGAAGALVNDLAAQDRRGRRGGRRGQRRGR